MGEKQSEVPGAARSRLPGTVLALGLASFFNDIGSEMCFPLLPAFLVTLGAGPTALGLIEGLADAVASLLKVLAGYLADRMRRVKPLVGVGYGLPCGVRPLLALATAPWQVLGVRLIDRVGKGLRTAPRDALIAGAVDDPDAGRAFGFHRAMDHAGGMLGPLVATALLAAGLAVRDVFLAALVPSLLALVAVAWTRERPRRASEASAPSTEHAASRERPRLPRPFRSYLGWIALFSLANSSDAFLLLRAGELGVATTALPLLWTALHVSRVVCTAWGGRLADRFSRPRLIALGWAIFALCYLGLGLASESWHVWLVFLVYGVHTGICEPAERALIRELAPEELRGRAFGQFHGVVGVCAIPAGFGMGWIWQVAGGTIALSSAAALAVLAAAGLLAWDRERVRGTSR